MNFKLFILLLFIAGCGSGKVVPTTDVCSLVKHWKDNVFKVKINDEKINSHWYIYDEAVHIVKDLRSKNKCKS